MTRSSLRSIGAGTIAAARPGEGDISIGADPELHRPIPNLRTTNSAIRNKTLPDVQALDLAYVSCAACPARPDGELKRNVE
jgi:hypothetical protein